MAVVVCCRDRATLLAAALPAILADLRDGDELVVVDSASQDARVRDVARLAGVRTLRADQPGLSRARNLGWRATSAPVVLFTDDDCRPLPGWRNEAAQALADPEVGAVWGQVVADRDSGIALSTGAGDIAELTDDTDLSQAGHGACMAFTRGALVRIGGFDEHLGAGGRFRSGEDKDALWRAHRSGLRVRAAERMAVTHVVHRDDAQARSVMLGYGVGAGVMVFKRQEQGGRRRLLWDELWRHGLLPAARWTRQREFAAARGALARSGGLLSGWWSVRGWVVVDGHLQAPPP